MKQMSFLKTISVVPMWSHQLDVSRKGWRRSLCVLAIAIALPSVSPAQEGVWSSPRRLGIAVNEGRSVEACVLADGSRMVFSSEQGLNPEVEIRPRAKDLWIVTLQPDGEFGDRRNLSQINSSWNDRYSSLSSDGSSLYFASDRESGGPVQWNIFVSPKTADTYGAPVLVAGLVNTGFDESHPVISETGLELFFKRGASIHLATRSGPDAEFDEVVDLGNFGLSLGESSTRIGRPLPHSLSSDGRVLFLALSDNVTFGHIYTVTREGPGAPFGAPVLLNLPVDRAVFSPFVSRDWPAEGSKLWFVTCEFDCQIFEATWVSLEPCAINNAVGLSDDCNNNGLSDLCEIAKGAEQDDNDDGIPNVCQSLVPGDNNGDGRRNIADPLRLLSFLFGGSAPECLRDPTGPFGLNATGVQLYDWNGDESVNLADPVAELNFLFGSGDPHVLGSHCRAFDTSCEAACF